MLSERSLEILKAMIGGDEEFVAEGLSCWVGEIQSSRSTLKQLLRHLTLTDVSDAGGIERYVVNGVGRSVVRRPELADEVLRAVLAATPFTVEDDRLVLIDAEQSIVNHPRM